jgi:hypothetical protein
MVQMKLWNRLLPVHLLFFAVLLTSNNQTVLADGLPDFAAGERIQAGNQDIGADSKDIYSVPHVVDWNADGKKDLLVGYFTFGPIYLFLNSGTDEAPQFTTFTKLQANGVDISVPFS